MAEPVTFIEGDRPETLFCRRCLVTLVVAGPPDLSYAEKQALTIYRHERQNPGRHDPGEWAARSAR